MIRRHSDRRGLPSALEILRNRRGNVLVMSVWMIILIICFAFLVVDGAIYMTTKTQLQNAADAAALAGVVGLFNGDSRPEGEQFARDEAVRIAGLNQAVQTDMASVVIDRDVDVSFPGDPGDMYVRVDTHRSDATGDPLRTWFRGIFKMFDDGGEHGNQSDVFAYAVAQMADICGVTCVKPWAIPDRYTDVDDSEDWTPGDFYDPVVTGFTALNDHGVQITLKIGVEPTVPGQYNPISLPPLNKGTPEKGANIYRRWIRECAPYLVEVGDILLLEPGAMVGPTNQGIRDLVALDPGARWNDLTNSIEGSKFAVSPRIALVPFYDPRIPQESGRNTVTVIKVGAFFIERQSSKEVTGRFLRVASPKGGLPCISNNQLAFLQRPILVE